jgi:hypothetical protein
MTFCFTEGVMIGIRIPGAVSFFLPINKIAQESQKIKCILSSLGSVNSSNKKMHNNYCFTLPFLYTFGLAVQLRRRVLGGGGLTYGIYISQL